MRSILKLGVPVVAAALALSACGGTTKSDDSSGGTKKCDQKIGFFGALTGPSANLGQNIKKGAQLAVDQYNTKNAGCKVTLVDFDSQGSPTAAQPLAKKAIDEKSIIGIVGPAFSGESEAADPTFAEAHLVTISASATDPALSTKGRATFFRILGNDATQGPAAAKYIQDVLKAQRVVVIDDASQYGKGLSSIVKKSLGSRVVDTDTIQVGQTDFGGTVTKIRAAKPDAVFFGGYYSEGGLIKKQMTDAQVKATFVGADGIKDVGFITAAGKSAAEGTIITCPCLPPEKVTGTFFEDHKKAFNDDPATYGAEAFDAATILLDGIKSGITDRQKMVDFVKSYDKPGVTKQLKFDDKGEPANVAVWAYKVTGAKIVPDQEVK